MSQHGSIFERSPLMLAVGSLFVILIGSVVTALIPFFMESMETKIDTVRPFTALELEGRDVYIREGCNNCHTQTVRPLRDEVLRYGEFSKSGEFVYDRPFLWGSKRTGPDLARIGGKYPDSWHYQHFRNPRAIVKDSNMPAYPWLDEKPLDAESIQGKLAGLRTLGVPYTDEDISGVPAMVEGKTEMDAMVAYMQILGTMIQKEDAQEVEAEDINLEDMSVDDLDIEGLDLENPDSESNEDLEDLNLDDSDLDDLDLENL